MLLNSVNFLVRSKLGLALSWQMPASDFLTMFSAAAACPLGARPPVFKHSSMDAKAVNFLVLLNEALVLS